MAHGAGHSSRILSVHTVLQPACKAHNIGYSDDFNLFWNRSSLFRTDRVHPNRLGSHMLAANINMLFNALHVTRLHPTPPPQNLHFLLRL